MSHSERVAGFELFYLFRSDFWRLEREKTQAFNGEDDRIELYSDRKWNSGLLPIFRWITFRLIVSQVLRHLIFKQNNFRFSIKISIHFWFVRIIAMMSGCVMMNQKQFPWINNCFLHLLFPSRSRSFSRFYPPDFSTRSVHIWICICISIKWSRSSYLFWLIN